MGRILQIRVGAWTYNEDEVSAAWPELAALVWPQLEAWGPVGMKHGVVELAEYLADAIRFGDLPRERRERLAPGAQEVSVLLEEMRAALADWNPRKANALSEQLEDALTNVERQLAEGSHSVRP